MEIDEEYVFGRDEDELHYHTLSGILDVMEVDPETLSNNPTPLPLRPDHMRTVSRCRCSGGRPTAIFALLIKPC